MNDQIGVLLLVIYSIGGMVTAVLMKIENEPDDYRPGSDMAEGVMAGFVVLSWPLFAVVIIPAYAIKRFGRWIKS